MGKAMIRLLNISIIVFLLTTPWTVYGVTSYLNESHDDDVLYYTYFILYEQYYEDVKEPTDIIEVTSNYTIRGRYILPQLPDFVLYVVDIGAEGKDGGDLVFIVRDREGRYGERAPFGYFFLGTPTIICRDLVNYSLNETALSFVCDHLTVPSYSDLYPGPIELYLLTYYLYECKYEDISYIYEKNFHILDPGNLPDDLVSGLTGEELEVLEDTLAGSYDRVDIAPAKYPSRYYGICTWSEYDGDLLLWNFAYSQISGICEVGLRRVANIGQHKIDLRWYSYEDFKEADIVVYKPLFKYEPSADYLSRFTVPMGERE
jgi:hypothetical protein